MGGNGLHCPILIGYNVTITNFWTRNIVLSTVIKRKFAAVCFGLRKDPFKYGDTDSLLDIRKDGKVVFEGTARFSKGTRLSVKESGTILFGDGFSSNANLIVNCANQINIGNDVLFGRDITIMDNDGGHTIKDEDTGEVINPSKPINIGNHVWIGYGCNVLKGSMIPDGTVVACNSTTSKEYIDLNSIIAGTPGLVKRHNVIWSH